METRLILSMDQRQMLETLVMLLVYSENLPTKSILQAAITNLEMQVLLKTLQVPRVMQPQQNQATLDQMIKKKLRMVLLNKVTFKIFVR